MRRLVWRAPYRRCLSRTRQKLTILSLTVIMPNPKNSMKQFFFLSSWLIGETTAVLVTLTDQNGNPDTTTSPTTSKFFARLPILYSLIEPMIVFQTQQHLDLRRMIHSFLQPSPETNRPLLPKMS